MFRFTSILNTSHYSAPMGATYFCINKRNILKSTEINRSLGTKWVNWKSLFALDKFNEIHKEVSVWSMRNSFSSL